MSRPDPSQHGNPERAQAVAEDLSQPELAVLRFRHALDEAPEGKSTCPTQRAREREVREHRVDPVRSFVHFLEEHDLPAKRRQVRGPGRVMDQGEVAAHQRPRDAGPPRGEMPRRGQLTDPRGGERIRQPRKPA